MLLPLLVIIILCVSQLTVIILFINHYRKWLTTMNGMLVSMSVGMTSGILFGTILGIFLHGDLLSSTIYSILIGILFGVLAGIPSGLLAVMDGMLSGLMGGMMGAMFGDMVAMSNGDAGIKVMSLFVTMLLILTLYSAEQSIRKQATQPIVTFFNYPFTILLITTLVYLGLSHFPIVL